MPALYNIHRPKTFSQVVGQEHIVQTLRNAVLSNAPAHAYLFCGSRGLGKTTLARVLARSLNCENQNSGEACLKCKACISFDEGNFLDLLEIDAASNTGVDNIRNLVETVNFMPTAGKYKIYIIDEAHMLSKGAWNALLKTLEEPPSHAVFVLATTEIGKVPDTINSRAQRFDFSVFPKELIEEHLERVLKLQNFSLPKEVLSMVAKSAQGSMRDALTLLDQVLGLGEDASLETAGRLLGVTNSEILEDLLRLIQKGQPSDIPIFFENLESGTVDLSAFCRDFLDLLRVKLQVAMQTGAKQESILYSFLTRLFLRAYKELSDSPDPALPMLLASLEGTLKYEKQEGTSIQANNSENLSETKILQKKPSEKAEELETKSQVKKIEEEGVLDTVQNVSTFPELAVGDLLQKWNDVCNKVKEVNSPLATLIRNSSLKELRAGTIFLEVKYLFHKEQLEATKNRELLGRVLESFYGKGLMVRGVLQEKVETVSDVADALKVFGGELVE